MRLLGPNNLLKYIILEQNKFYWMGAKYVIKIKIMIYMA